MNKLAPIVLFTYNRLFETKKTVEALSRNYLANNSELFIYSDQGKDDLAKEKVSAVRAYLRTIDGFKKVNIKEAPKNMGLAKSIISGVSEVLEKNERVIVIEDDLVTSRNFLDYMNQALNFYANEKEVISISGYTLNLPTLRDYDKDYYVCLRASSWGWGIWWDRWKDIDWKVSNYDEFINNPNQRKKFALISSDLPRMLKNQMTGKIDSWAIRLSYHQFKNEMIAIFPTISKLTSIGNNEDATHTMGVTKFDTAIDSGDERTFLFDKNPRRNERIISDFRKVFSVRQRLWDKVIRFKKRMKK